MWRRPFLALALCLGLLATAYTVLAQPTDPPPLRPVTTYPLPDPAWRITISHDGLYRLDRRSLLQAGVPLSSTPPSAYQIIRLGQPVALHEQGLADGSFDAGDALLFYARRLDACDEPVPSLPALRACKYTDAATYYLTIAAGASGRRMVSRSVAPDTAFPPRTVATATLLIEQNNLYWARWSQQPGTPATWFWERTLASSQPVTRSYPFTLSAVSTRPGATALLHLEVAARNSGPADPDHHLRWLVNGAPIGEDTWDGKVGAIFTHTLPASLLQTGHNRLQMVLLPDVGIQDILFDRALLVYPRPLQLNTSSLSFSAPRPGPATYTITGVRQPPLLLLDIGDPRQPVVLAHAAYSAGQGLLRFSDRSQTGSVYALFTTAQPLTPTRIAPPAAILNPSAGADEIIIAPQRFYTATLPLVEHRRHEGLRVQLVRVEDLYTLFNGGDFHPRAIRDFLTYAYGHWPGPPPAYVLLVGDGNFNFKGYNPQLYGAPQPNDIPPYLDFLDPDQGEIAVDSRYAAIFQNDPLPAMAVGRLPAANLGELQNMIAKLLAYDPDPQAPVTRRALFVSDNTPDSAGDFDGVIDALAALSSPPLQARRLALSDACGAPGSQPRSCAITLTRQLTQSWSAGANLLTYAGHGAVYRWAHEPLLTNDQLPTLQPGPLLPVVLSLDCLDGYFMLPPSYPGLANTRSLAEIALALPERGAIAYFAPAGLGTTGDEYRMIRAFYNALFGQGARRLGDLTQAARRASYSHLGQSYTLFGDPAQRLVLPDYNLFLPLALP